MRLLSGGGCYQVVAEGPATINPGGQATSDRMSSPIGTEPNALLQDRAGDRKFRRYLTDEFPHRNPIGLRLPFF
jgi:hypothetical protein